MSEPLQRQLARTLYRNLWALAVLTGALLATLAVAPAKSHFSEWRQVQHEYNRRAEEAGQAPMTVGLTQIWRPEVNLTDRCTSCHVGMGAARALPDGGPLYGRHPDVTHNVGRMGCTICHRGQGRATTAEDAHGAVKHWDDPMLPKPLLQASCGPCHGNTTLVPERKASEQGKYLFDLHGCLTCHTVDGQGGGVGPDLSGVALKGFSHEWQRKHLMAPTDVVEGSKMMSFGHLTEPEVVALLAYLDTLVGAPQAVLGKAITVEHGCRGCHRIGGVGGDHGPDLSNFAGTTVAGRDFSHVEGPQTLDHWTRAHLRDPQKVTADSKMPPVRLPEDQENALVTYLMSLRTLDVPLEALPKAAIAAKATGARDYRHDGATLYQTFCSSCHGRDGNGKVMPTLGSTVPGLRTADMLAVASDDYMLQTLRNGRGEDMPAWATKDGGLNDEEIALLIAYLRNEEPEPPTWEQVQGAAGLANVETGGKVFRSDCGGCHGLDGDGTDLAPSLANAEFQFVASDAYLHETITRGRANTAMPAHRHYRPATVASVIAWIRDQRSDEVLLIGGARVTDPESAETALHASLHVRKLADYRATGSPAYGKLLFDQMCVGCHGEAGRGGTAPAIGNPAFLKKASDGMIAGTLLLGRGGRAMRSFGPGGFATLEARQMGDIITYLRQASAQPVEQLGHKRVQGIATSGGQLFGQMCSGCHGADGQGASAPSLNSQGFLNAASDGFLQATIARGRRGTAMRGWSAGAFGIAELEPAEINNIVSHIRTWQQGN
jgi:mono/diheme cytochrome c family protein